MGNGKNEPVEFTREDAERLRVIEVGQNTLVAKLDSFLERYVLTKEQVDRNTRFRSTAVKIVLWVFTSSAGIGLLAAAAGAIGWLN